MEKCENCDQLVPSANMALHRAHCERNISRCSACKAPIQISDMEAHRAAHAARTRLFGACEQIDLDLARDCLEHGADCNASNEAGNTLLHIAARMGSPDLIQLLIGAKATLAQNNLHDTPLDVAYKVNSNAVIIKLLQQIQPALVPHTPPRALQPAMAQPRRRLQVRRQSSERISFDCQAQAVIRAQPMTARPVSSKGSNRPAVIHAPPATARAVNSAKQSAAAGRAHEQTVLQLTSCPNCLEYVPQHNIDLHLVHCERIKHRCTMCGLVMPIDEKEQHYQHYGSHVYMMEAIESMYENKEEIYVHIDRFVSHSIDLEEQVGTSGETAMHLAVRLGALHVVKQLFNSGASVQILNCMHDTPMQIAQRLASKGGQHQEVLAFLVSNSV